MPKFSHSDLFDQIQQEVDRLEQILIEQIHSKTNMKSSRSPEDKTVTKQLQQTPIAIVGMASIFPRSQNLQQYWQTIVGKEDCITDVPPSRWNVDDYYDPDPTAPDKTYCKRGGFIEAIDFNPMEFGIPPNQLEVTDISQLLGLVVAREALKDAGYEERSFDKEHTGVVLGVALARQLTMPLAARLQYPIWEKALKSSGIPEAQSEIIINKIKDAYINWEPNAFPGMLANIVAGRIANRFDFGGMNCVVDAACASSFGALSMAISELTSRRANMMLTGGVDTDNSILAYMCFSKTPAVSSSQTPKPFDIDSDGMMLGEGAGMLVLKRLEDAEADGDRIYAVIKGIGTSSDGRHKSIYAPRPEGQMRALRRAYREAGFEPTTVGAIEAHGTGTMAGDPAEFTALKAVFGEDNDVKQQIALGSIKSQIGHTKAAAGAASLIKTALALHHKVLPPTINVSKPHPKLEIEDSPFYLNTETRPWLKASTEPRRAGVSSFGFGGTNYHIVLEEYQSEHERDRYRLHQTPQEILIDAPTTEQLIDKCQFILKQLQSEAKESYWLELIKESKAEIPVSAARLGFVAVSVNEATHKLQKGIDTLQKQSHSTHWEHPLGIFYRQTGIDKPKVVALFSGQSSQYLEMGRELTMNFPALRETYSRVDSLLERDGLEPISKAVFPPPVFDEAQKQQQIETLQRTEIAQPAIAAFSTGLYKILQQAGFKPDFVAGHSFGELTALWAAGVLNDEDYYFLVKERGQAMATPTTKTEAGAMLAVKGDVNKIKTAIESWDVAIANWNSPQQIVLAGDKAQILDLKAQLEQQGYSAVVLPVSAAFHTPLVGHAQAPFAKALEAVTFNPPQIPVFTNVSAKPYPQEPEQCREILKQHLLSQVSFQKEIENIYDAGGTCFVEFGPRSILTYLVKEILGDRDYLAVALNPSRQKDSDLQLKEAVVQLRVAGLSLPDLDPYQIVQTAKKEKHPLNVRLECVNYVSEKTQKTMERTLGDELVTGEHNGMKKYANLNNNLNVNSSSNRPLALKTVKNSEKPQSFDKSNLTLTNGDRSSANPIQKQETVESGATSIKPEHSRQLATMNDLSLIPTPAKRLPNQATAIPLDRILSSLEYTIGQFHQHQQETLEVHKQYLNYQSQYAQTFFELMQQQNQLCVNVQTAPQEIGVKTAVIESAERSMMKFQEHQANTLRVHEQYLNHQADYAKNFFLLTQQSYARFLEGDYRLISDRYSSLSPSEEEVITTEPITTKQVTTEPDNGNGHHPLSKIETETNGNGHHPLSESVEIETNGNGHHPLSESVEIETNGNAHHPLSEVEALETSKVATPASPTAKIDFVTLSGTLLDVVSEKTGYPAEMLELDMDMEADLGIDSIKRVEILGALQEEMPDLPQPNLEDLGDLRTLSQIIEYLRNFDSQTKVESVAATQPDLETTLLKIVSEKTGYPVQSLNLEMNLKTDLGIDLVKQRGIFDSLQEQKPDILPTEEAKLAVLELDTIAQVLDYLKSDETQKKTSLSAMSL